MSCTDSIYNIGNFTFVNPIVFVTDKNMYDLIKSKIPDWNPDLTSSNNNIVIVKDSINNITSIYDLQCVINIACLTKLYGNCDVFSDYTTINSYTISRIKAINLSSQVINSFNFKLYLYSNINMDNSKPVLKTRLDKPISQQYEYVINYQFDNFNVMDTKIKSVASNNVCFTTPTTQNSFTLGSTTPSTPNSFGFTTPTTQNSFILGSTTPSTPNSFGFTTPTTQNSFGSASTQNSFGFTTSTPNSTSKSYFNLSNYK